MAEERSIYGGFISGNQLKMIACITMLIDHIGWLLLPDILILRIIGRISMPLFAFTFGEGCHYTRSKGKHFALVLICGLVTSAAMSFVMGEIYGNILITFSLSALIIYALDALKRAVAIGTKGQIAGYSFALAGAVLLAVGLCCFAPVDIDYGIAGVMLPVCTRLLYFGYGGRTARLAPAYNFATVMALFFVNLAVLSAVYGIVQLFSILAMLPILAYSGKRGKHRLKGLFYAFYPAHLLFIAGVYLILNPGYLGTLF